MSEYRPEPDIITDRLMRLRQKMADNELDGLFISQPYNRRYFSGYTAEEHALNESVGFLLVTARGYPRGDADDGKAYMIVNLLHEGHARHDVAGTEVEVVSYYSTGRNLPTVLTELFRNLRLRRVGFESAFLTYGNYRTLEKISEGAVEGTAQRKAELVALSNFADDLRVIKTPDEIAALQQAIDISDAAYEYILTVVQPGMTERQVAWELDKFFHDRGADGPSFPTMVASGPNSAIPHHATGNRVIQAGEPLLIDMGCRVNGYISDITRTFCLGEPDETFRKVYPIVLAANQAVAAGARAGITGKEYDALARDIIDASEYKGHMVHSVGHGIGIAVHEAPSGSVRSETNLAAGMLITNEPGIYIEGWGGVRIEDVLLIQEQGAQVLTKASKYVVG